MQLPGYTETVSPVTFLQIGIETVCRTEESNTHGLAKTLEAMPQRSKRSLSIHPLAQCLQHPLASLVAVQGLQLFPVLGLGIANKIQSHLGKDGLHAVERFGVVPFVSLSEQYILGGGLEGGF